MQTERLRHTGTPHSHRLDQLPRETQRTPLTLHHWCRAGCVPRWWRLVRTPRSEPPSDRSRTLTTVRPKELSGSRPERQPLAVSAYALSASFLLIPDPPHPSYWLPAIEQAWVKTQACTRINVWRLNDVIVRAWNLHGWIGTRLLLD